MVTNQDDFKNITIEDYDTICLDFMGIIDNFALFQFVYFLIFCSIILQFP